MTALTPLAQVADVQALMATGTTLDTSPTGKPTALLKRASWLIRRHTRQDFTKSQTVEIIAPVDNQIILPQRPVVSIDGVGRVNADGVTILPYSIWTWDGVATIMLGPPTAIVNAPEYWTDLDWFWRNLTYQITYTHGYDVIPEDVVGVCADMVYRVLTAPTSSQGLDSEMLSGYSWKGDGTIPIGRVALSDEDKEILEVYRGRRNRTIELR